MADDGGDVHITLNLEIIHFRRSNKNTGRFCKQLIRYQGRKC